MNRVLAAALVALGALGPAAVRAEGSQRDYVVLLLPAEESPTARRLKAEVAKLDLAVHVAQTDEPVDPDEPRMAELAQLFGGEALVVLSSDGRVATIWFSHAEQGEKLKRVVQAQSGSPDLRSESVVVGTVELLRVRLLTRREVPEPEPARPKPAPPPPPPPPPPVHKDYRPLVLGAVVGLDKAGSKFSFGSSYQFSADFQVAKPLSLRALVRLPAASSQTKLKRASAELQAVMPVGGLALGFNPVPVLRLDLFAGGGAAHVVAQGFSPQVAATTSQQSKWVGVGVGGVRSAFQIVPILNVTAQGSLTVSAVPVEIVLNDETAAVWGRPALFFGIGLELRPDLR